VTEGGSWSGQCRAGSACPRVTKPGSTSLRERCTAASQKHGRRTSHHGAHSRRPDAQLNFWTIVMLATAGTITGVFAEFLVIQNRMQQAVPWCVASSLPVPSCLVSRYLTVSVFPVVI
jgi:hypothetical protein